MLKKNLNNSEYKLISIIWENEPVNSTNIVKLCEESLNWKKSTTYTVLRKLIEKQYVENCNSIVSSIVKKTDSQKQQSNKIIKEVFNNSLPSFVTAFLSNNKLSSKDIEELQEIIEEARNK